VGDSNEIDIVRFEVVRNLKVRYGLFGHDDSNLEGDIVVFGASLGITHILFIGATSVATATGEEAHIEGIDFKGCTG
jgi:hypothetical protein